MSSPTYRLAAPVVNAVVLRVTDRLETLLWRRSRPPAEDTWSLPGGFVRQGESLEGAMRRHLAGKVGVTDVGAPRAARLAQRGHPPGAVAARRLLPRAHPARRRAGAARRTPSGTRSRRCPTVAFGHAAAIERAHERLRGKLSYSNAAFALAPPRFTLRELADVYEAVLGYAVSPTNLGRVLGRDGLLAPTGGHRRAGAAGGRPAAEFAFTRRELVVSRPLAAFKPPGE